MTCCGELRAEGAVTVTVPLSKIPLTVTTCCVPPSSVPLVGERV